jgi:hypothetical protein
MFYPNEPIINESTIAQHLGDEGHVCGTLQRDYSSVPVGSIGGAPSGDTIPLIPREEWPDRISQMEREKSRLSDMMVDAGIPVLNQGPLSFCWAYSCANAVMAMRAQQGLPFVLLSPESIAGPVNGYRDGGNYIVEALRQVMRVGIASVEFVPFQTVSKRGFRDGWEQDAAKHRAIEFWDMPNDGQRFARQMSVLFARQPMPGAHNWERHSVVAVDPVMRKVGNKIIFGHREMNSWGGTGWRIVDEPYCFDEAYALRAISQG